MVEPVTRWPVCRLKTEYDSIPPYTDSTGLTGKPNIIENLKFSVLFVDILDGKAGGPGMPFRPWVCYFKPPLDDGHL